MGRFILDRSVLFAVSAAAICLPWACTPTGNSPPPDVLAALEAASEESAGEQVTAQAADPVVNIEASINGQDADTPPGPFIVVGDPVNWTATVTNQDTAPLTEIVVTDDQFGPASCPATELAVGGSMTCQITGTAAAGQHSSMAKVTAKRSDGSATEDEDPTNYFGVAQGQLACTAGGPYTGECQGGSAAIQLSGAVTSAPSGATLTFAWTSDCPGAAFDDASSPTPKLTVDASGACSISCKLTLTVSDGTGGSSTCQADVTVADTQAPTFNSTPADLTLECGDADNAAKAQAWLAAVTATDGCGTATVTNDFTALPAACSGPLKVTWTAKDACGHSVTASANLTVADTSPPVFSTTPKDLTLDCAASDKEAQVQAWLAAVTATDECGTVTVTNDFTKIPDACAAPVTVTWKATNTCGLTATVSAKLSVTDTVAPVITLNGEAKVTVECHTGTYTELGASVTDNCDTALTEATVGGDVVDVNTPGTYVVTYNAVDACGNAAQQVTRTVEVVDTTPPVVTVKGPLTLWPPNHKYAEYKLSDIVSVEDACEGSLDVNATGRIVSIYSDEPEDAKGGGDGNTMDDIVILGPSSFKVRAERQGGGNGRVYGIAFAVTDAAGNETTGMAFVAVPHDQSGRAAVDEGPSAGYTVTP